MHGLHLGFLRGIKVCLGLDEQLLITNKVIRWLLSFARGGQSVTTYFCVDKLSELQISLVGELSSAIRLILMRCAGIHIQLKPLKLIPVDDA